MNTDASLVIRVSRHYDASPERVFDAWLDPVQAGRFLFATPTGEMQRVEIDPRVGGKFTIIERRGDVDAPHHGEYLEIDRPRRLALRFYAGNCSDDATPVAIEIAPQESGCGLILTHEMDPAWAEYKERTAQGWNGILEGLARVLA
jgi:uncharacterized protein YndB with AHSA1/START domain